MGDLSSLSFRSRQKSRNTDDKHDKRGDEGIVYLGVAGSTPALGFLDARLAQSVEHKTLILVSVSFCQLVLFGALGLCRVRKQGLGRDPFYFFDRAHGEMVS